MSLFVFNYGCSLGKESGPGKIQRWVGNCDVLANRCGVFFF